MRHRYAAGLILTACIALFVLSGCGASLVPVKGKLTQGGAPFAVGPKGRVQLMFIPVAESSGGKSTYPASVAPDGTFTVAGTTKGGIPPGKYKVAVEVLDPYPFGKDQLGGKYAPQTTTLEREIKRGEDVVIDLAKP